MFNEHTVYITVCIPVSTHGHFKAARNRRKSIDREIESLMEEYVEEENDDRQDLSAGKIRTVFVAFSQVVYR